MILIKLWWIVSKSTANYLKLRVFFPISNASLYVMNEIQYAKYVTYIQFGFVF